MTMDNVQNYDNASTLSRKFPGEKGSVRKRVVVMQQPVILSSKFGTKPSHSRRKTSQ
jgi:hypothetical protein